VHTVSRFLLRATPDPDLALFLENIRLVAIVAVAFTLVCLDLIDCPNIGSITWRRLLSPALRAKYDNAADKENCARFGHRLSDDAGHLLGLLEGNAYQVRAQPFNSARSELPTRLGW
jgi:hypothetical protein